MVNRLVLSGIICKTIIQQVSPSGIPHCQFELEHRSIQKEAGYYRKVWCRIPVISSGCRNQHQIVTQNITIGSTIIIQGFISFHKIQNNLTRLVLHAEKIELIGSEG